MERRVNIMPQGDRNAEGKFKSPRCLKMPNTVLFQAPGHRTAIEMRFHAAFQPTSIVS